MKKIILLFLVLSIFISCKPAQLVVCKYSGHSRFSFGHYLTLNVDNTFEYEYMVGWGRERIWVSGIWKKEDNKLLIDSRDSLMQSPLPLSVQESRATGNNQTFILNFTPECYTNWVLIANEKSYPLQGDTILRIRPAQKIEQFYLTAQWNPGCRPLANRESIKTQSYVLQNENTNHTVISIPLLLTDKGRYAGYELLNDTLVIKKNKLVWRRKNLILKPHKKEGY
jgi:hypothetical protein